MVDIAVAAVVVVDEVDDNRENWSSDCCCDDPWLVQVKNVFERDCGYYWV